MSRGERKKNIEVTGEGGERCVVTDSKKIFVTQETKEGEEGRRGGRGARRVSGRIG